MKFAIANSMKRAMLLGKDPIFAWALEKMVHPLGYSLEHVFTMSEARIRMRRFQYEMYFLDGLPETEIDFFSQHKDPHSVIIVFEDTSESSSFYACEPSPKGCGVYSLPKECEPPCIVAFLKKLLAHPQVANHRPVG